MIQVLKLAIRDEHTICLCTFSIDELRLVVKRKSPDKIPILELFLSEFSYELLLTPVVLPQGLPSMRDAKDLPVLASVMMGDVDLLLTGDKDFDSVDIERRSSVPGARIAHPAFIGTSGSLPLPMSRFGSG